MDSQATEQPRESPQPLKAEPALLVIEPRSGWQFLNLAELWRYREMLFFLVWRDVKVRYKQTFLGIAWAVLQPVSMTIVFSLFLGRLAEFERGMAAPYPLFVLTGLLPWMFFANAVSSAASSLVSSQNMLTKVYFPRLIVPFAAVAAAFVDFLITLLMLGVIMFFYDWPVDADVFWLGPLLMLLVAAATGIGTLLAALTVKYRDFRHIITYCMQLWMLATPVIYLRFSTDLNPRWNWVLPLNPMHGIILNFRAATLGYEYEPQALVFAIAISVGLLLFGCYYFRRVERYFADII